MAYKAQSSFSSKAVGDPLAALKTYKQDVGRIKVRDVSSQALDHIQAKDEQFDRIIEGGMDLAATEVPVGMEMVDGKLVPKTEQFHSLVTSKTKSGLGKAWDVGKAGWEGVQSGASRLSNYMEARKANNLTKEIETSHYDRPMSEVQESEYDEQKADDDFAYMKERAKRLKDGDPILSDNVGESGSAYTQTTDYDPNVDYSQVIKDRDDKIRLEEDQKRDAEFSQRQLELEEKHLKETEEKNKKATLRKEYDRLTEEQKVLDAKAAKSAKYLEDRKKGAFIHKGELYNEKNYNKDGSIDAASIAKQAVEKTITPEVVDEIRELKYQSKMYGDWAKGKGQDAVRLAELGKKNGLSEKENNELRSAVDKFKKDHPKTSEESVEIFEAAYFKSITGRKKKKINLKKKVKKLPKLAPGVNNRYK